MKKLLTVLLLFSATVCFGQRQQPLPQSYVSPRFQMDSVLTIPIGVSRLRNLVGARNTGQIRYNPIDSSLYIYTGFNWMKLAGIPPISPKVDSVVVTDKTVCQWINGVPTCYTITSDPVVFTGIERITVTDSTICHFVSDIQTCYSLRGPGVDSAKIKLDSICQWINAVSNCYKATDGVISTSVDSIIISGNDYYWWGAGVSNHIVINNFPSFDPSVIYTILANHENRLDTIPKSVYSSDNTVKFSWNNPITRDSIDVRVNRDSIGGATLQQVIENSPDNPDQILNFHGGFVFADSLQFNQQLYYTTSGADSGAVGSSAFSGHSFIIDGESVNHDRYSLFAQDAVVNISVQNTVSGRPTNITIDTVKTSFTNYDSTYKVGINTEAPTAALDINGNTRFRANGTPASGKVATGTDGLGNWTWQTPSGGSSTTGKTVYIAGTGQSNQNVNDQTLGTFRDTIDARIKTLTSSGLIQTADLSSNNVAYDDVITTKRNNSLFSAAKKHLVDHPYDSVVLVSVAVGSKGSWEWTPKTTGAGEVASTNTMLSLFMNRINLLPAGAKIDMLVYQQGEQDVVSGNMANWLNNVIEFRDSCAKHAKFNSDFTMLINYPVYARGYGAYQPLCTAIDSLLLTKKDLAMRKMIPVAYDLPNNTGDTTHFTNEAIEQIGIKDYTAYKTGKPVYDIIPDSTIMKKGNGFNYATDPFVFGSTARYSTGYKLYVEQNGSTNAFSVGRNDASGIGTAPHFNFIFNNSPYGGAFILRYSDNGSGTQTVKGGLVVLDSSVAIVDSTTTTRIFEAGKNAVIANKPFTASSTARFLQDVRFNGLTSAINTSTSGSVFFIGTTGAVAGNETGLELTAGATAGGSVGSPLCGFRGKHNTTGGYGYIYVSPNFSTRTQLMGFTTDLKVTIGTATTGIGWLTLPAGTTATGSLNLPSGTLTTTPVNGNVENDGGRFYITLGGVRYFISLTTSGTSAPATTPAAVGLRFINTAAGTVYEATGTSSSADWKLLN